ncbi:MAG: UvrD-helicase domain-containing protein [Anaerosomatales bacterium]|nr:UvrD-helicase domain-containing protein [Anaerosomatales bacterium]
MQVVPREAVVREGRGVIEDLSGEQREAVEARGPRVLVSAGAGAGKTRVLTARFLQSVAEGLDLDEVAAVTFTEKAAGELKRRIRDGLVRGGRLDDARRVPDAWVSTIHGLCHRILREHGLQAGVDPGSRILTEHEALVLAEEAFEAATNALIDVRDEDVLAVLEAEDVARVAKRVRAVHGKAVSAGLDPTAVEGQPPVDPADLERIAAGLRQAARDMLDLANTDNQRDGVDNVLRLAEVLERAAGTVAHDAQAALAALAESESLSVYARGSAEFRKIASEAKALREAARALLAQAACAPHERGLAKLVARFAQEFARAKREAGALDFDDLQTHVARLLKEPRTARAIAGRFAEVMVDEYQDTNPLQAAIAEALAGGSLVAVGDKRQSIYRFRYADVRVFERFAEHAVVKPLTENWRSHPDVLAVVNAAFRHPGLFGDDHQVLRAASGAEDGPWLEGEPRVKALFAVAEGVGAAEARRAEAAAVAAEIERLCSNPEISPGDVAILSRVVADRAVLFENALRARGIEAACGAGNLFDTPEVQDGLMLLRAIDNVLDDEALAHVLLGPIGDVGPDAVVRLREAGESRSLWHGLEQAEEVLQAPERERAVAVRDAVLAGRRYLGASNPGRALLVALRRSGYEAVLEAGGASGAQALENLRLLARLVDESDEVTGRGLHGFLREVEVLKASGAVQVASRESPDAVRIMSIHAAKGLEFPVVFVVGLTEDDRRRDEETLVDCDGNMPRIALRGPLGDASDSSAKSTAYVRLADEAKRQDEEEAKRLLYVAMTRAERALVLSGSIGKKREAMSAANRSLFDALGVDLDPASEQEATEVAGVRVPVLRRFPDADAGGDGVEPALPSQHAPERPESGAWERSEPTPRETPRAPVRRISPSALEDFERCPYRYYARHVLGLRDLREDAGATAFGTAVHAALQHAVVGTWSVERQEALARRHGLEDQDASRLDEAVAAFRSSGLLDRIRQHERVGTERPFGVAVDDALLVGRMDVFAESDGRCLVVDFKSHAPDAGDGASTRAGAASRFERQMRCYAFAALAGGACEVETVVYDVNGGAASGAWVFEPGRRDELEEELREILRRIASADFEPRGQYDHASCVGCPALEGLCPVRAPRRAAGAVRTRR